MSRLNGLLERTLTETLRILRMDFNEFKNRQRTSGRTGVLGYLSQTSSTWDYNQTLNSPPVGGIPSGSYAVFEGQFVGDGSQRWPIVTPYFEITVNDQPLYRNGNGQLAWDDGSGNNFLVVDDEGRRDPTTVTSPNTTKWAYTFSYFGTMTVKIKLRTVGTSRGTVTLTRTS